MRRSAVVVPDNVLFEGGVGETMHRLAEFVGLYQSENRALQEDTWSEETPDGRWRAYSYEQLMAWDKANFNDAASLEAPEVIAASIIEDLQTALDEIAQIYADLAPVEADILIS